MGEGVHSAVEVENLTKYYGQLLVVDHISFRVRQGESFGFLGPNGAGKTTTVRMLTGIMKGNEGNAWVMGHPAGSVAAKQVSGVVPELSNAYLDLYGWGNLMLMAELYRVPKARAKARGENLLTVLGLYDRKDSLTKTYSMGMLRRLIVAAALLSDPEIIFLDEPTSGLDVQSARLVRGFLRDLKKDGKTLFLTTHNMDEAAEMCDRVGIINRGKLVALDSPDNLRITAGKVYLVEVSFDQPVSDVALLSMPGVNRVERAQAIEAAERMRMQTAMLRRRPGMGGPGGQRPGAGRGPGVDSGPGMQGSPGDGGPRAAVPEGGMAGQIGANRVRLYTEDTTQLVTALVDFSRAHALQMRILQVRSPSLEDAFVRLTEGVGHEP